MKRTCDGCKALMKMDFNSTCGLGFRLKAKLSDKALEFVPDEPCPKPMTNRKYVDLLLHSEGCAWTSLNRR